MDKPPERGGRESQSYGNRRFYVPPDAKLSLSGVLCDACSDQMSYSGPALHRECAARLRALLGRTFPARARARRAGRKAEKISK